MIPLFALMVGCYIITRMIELFGRDNPSDDPVTKYLILISSAITILVAIYCVYMILGSGVESSSLFK